MNGPRQYVPGSRRRNSRGVLVLAFLACTGSTPLLWAQVSAFDTHQTASAALPAGPGTLPAIPQGLAIAPQTARPVFDPFKPRPKFGTQPEFGIRTGPTDMAWRLNSSPSDLGVWARSASGFGQPAASAIGESQANLAKFFQAEPLAFAPANSAYETFGAAPGTLPTLNQLMRANLRSSIGASPADFRFSFQDRLGLVGNSQGADFAHTFATGMFTSADLGNGMTLSAGTGSGRRSAVGAPAASLGNNSGAPRRSGPSVAIKLSF